MEPIIIEIRLSQNTEALLKKFAPISAAVNQQLLPQSPAEQAARKRMQQAPAPMPPRSAPTYAPQQYRPQPGPTPAAPYAVGSAAPGVPTAPPAAPIRSQQPAPVNPTPVGPSTAQPAAAQSNPAPVAAAPAYEQDQLARAASTLVDAGKMQQVQQLFQQFQIQRMDQLPKERYGEFATALRGLGVRI